MSSVKNSLKAIVLAACSALCLSADVKIKPYTSLLTFDNAHSVKVDLDTAKFLQGRRLFLSKMYPCFRVRMAADFEGYEARAYADIPLHRFVVKAAAGVIVDHINSDTLDCRRKNLRVCKHFENLRNRGKSKNNTSGYKGVVVNRAGTPSESFSAVIRYGGKNHLKGTFSSREVAARVYDREALLHHGEYARLNFEQDRKTAAAYVVPSEVILSRRPSKSGYTGVYLNKLTGTYYAQVVIENKAKTVGTGFRRPELAWKCRATYLANHCKGGV